MRKPRLCVPTFYLAARSHITPQILAVFESSAHHLYTPERERQSLILLDHIVRALGLTFLDNNEPEVSAFTPNTVPVAHKRSYDRMSKDGLRSPGSSSRKCACVPVPPNASMAADHFSSSWTYAPPWDPAWTPDEMHKEACRRLCWSALNLVASYTSHCIAFRKEPTDLYLTDPANVSIRPDVEFISTIMTPLFSSGYCFRVRYPSVAPPTTRCNHQRTRYGRFIAAACSSGIFARPALGRTPTRGKIRLSWLWNLGGKPRKYRTRSSCTRATSIWRSCICVGSTCTSA